MNSFRVSWLIFDHAWSEASEVRSLHLPGSSYDTEFLAVDDVLMGKINLEYERKKLFKQSYHISTLDFSLFVTYLLDRIALLEMGDEIEEIFVQAEGSLKIVFKYQNNVFEIYSNNDSARLYVPLEHFHIGLKIFVQEFSALVVKNLPELMDWECMASFHRYK